MKANSINENIFSELQQIRPQSISVDPGIFGKDFDRQYGDFDEKFEIYSPAERMRSLRALVQTALEKTCKHHNVELGEAAKRTIDRLSGNLIKNKIIEPNLKKWFDVFSDVANKSAHSDYPSTYDLLDKMNENQYGMCIDIGIWLMSKLGKTIGTDGYEFNV